MKGMIPRAVAALGCAFALLICGGCGKTNQTGVVKDYDETPKVTLSIFTGTSLSEDIWNKGFTARDGTSINVVEYSSEYYEKENLPYRDLVRKRLESNVDIDCYVIHAEDVIEFSRMNYWMDLSGLDAAVSLSEDAIWQSTYDGKVFSIPLTYTGFGFYWNVDLLEKHDLTVPDGLSSFLHVCETLKAAGITPYLGNKGYALTVPAMAMGFAEVYASEDSARLLADIASGTTPVSRYMADGFEFIEMLIQEGYMDPEQALNTTPGAEDLQRFLNGEGAIMCAALRSFENAPFKIKMTGVPVLENGEVAVVGASDRLAINPNSPNVEYAAEMLNGMITTEWLADFARNSHSLSSGKGEYDLAYLGEMCNGFAKLVQRGKQVPNQDFTFPFNTWEAIRNLCREICAGVSAGEVTHAYDQIQREQIAQASK